MAAVYPTAIKSFKSRQNYTMIVDAGDVNQAYDEIQALQTVLGAMPHQDTLDGQTKTWSNVKTSIASARRGLTDPICRVTATNFRVPFNDDTFPVFTSKQVDTHGMWQGGPNLVCPRTGWYHIAGYIRWHKDGANLAAQTQEYDRSGKSQIGICKSTDTVFLTGQTSFYPKGWQDLTRADTSGFIYWTKGSAIRLNVYQAVLRRERMWATAWLTAAYHRDPPTANNM